MRATQGVRYTGGQMLSLGLKREDVHRFCLHLAFCQPVVARHVARHPRCRLQAHEEGGPFVSEDAGLQATPLVAREEPSWGRAGEDSLLDFTLPLALPTHALQFPQRISLRVSP